MDKMISQVKLENAIRDYAKSNKNADCSTILDIIEIMDEMEVGNNAEGLFPCPFCGSDDVALEDVGNVGEFEDWIVSCKGCGIGMMPSSGGGEGYVTTREEAIAAWNRRAVDG